MEVVLMKFSNKLSLVIFTTGMIVLIEKTRGKKNKGVEPLVDFSFDSLLP